MGVRISFFQGHNVVEYSQDGYDSDQLKHWPIKVESQEEARKLVDVYDRKINRWTTRHRPEWLATPTSVPASAWTSSRASASTTRQREVARLGSHPRDRERVDDHAALLGATERLPGSTGAAVHSLLGITWTAYHDTHG